MSMPTLAPPAAEARPVDPDRIACFHLRTEVEPGALPRVLELFAKRGLVPERVLAEVVGAPPAEPELQIELSVSAMARAESEQIAAALRMLPMVLEVQAAERRRLSRIAA